MNISYYFLVALFSLLPYYSMEAQQEEKEGVDIKVEVIHVSNSKGQVLLSLHTKKTWLKGPGVQNLSAQIVDGQSEAVFKNVPRGTYAIMVMHDENNNNDMDVNTLGLPKEQYGSSRNPPKIGPPIFGEAKFKVKKEDLRFKIKV